MITRTCLLITALLATGAFAQRIDLVSPNNPTRSGLVRIAGSGFGAGGQVMVAGQEAPLASWNSTQIEFYVPESAPLGPISIQVKVPVRNIRRLGTNIDIQPRAPMTGRFKWRFQAADPYITTRPALGADGTIYALGAYGHIYALAPDGALKWVRQSNIAGCISVLPNGNIVCGGGGGIQAFSPDGDQLWNFPLATPLLAGPNVGPDGNIYAVDNVRWGPNVLGAIVLSPSGDLIWHGGEYYGRGADYTPKEVTFSNSKFFFTSGSGTGQGTPGLIAVDLGGGQTWVNPDGVGVQPAGTSSGVAAVGTSTLDMFSNTGSLAWSVSLYDFGGAQPGEDVVTSSDGSTYLLTRNWRLNAVNANGGVRYSMQLNASPNQLAVTPDGQRLVLQAMPNFGVPLHLRGYGPSGVQLWQSPDLPVELGWTISIYNRMVFTPDSSTAYFGTTGPMTSQTSAYSYIYSMDVR